MVNHDDTRAWYVSVRKIWPNKLTFLLLTLLLEFYNKKAKLLEKNVEITYCRRNYKMKKKSKLNLFNYNWMNILLKIKVYKVYRCILFYIKSLWILNVVIEWEMFKIKKKIINVKNFVIGRKWEKYYCFLYW